MHPRNRIPHHAEIALAAVVCALVLTIDLRGAIGFSSFGVLIYYSIANASAFTQPPEQRRWPRWLNVLGVAGCLTLIVTLPLQAVVPGWREGVQLMNVGSKYKLWIPASLGYGETGTPGGPIPPNATLVFEIELLGIGQPQPQPGAAPQPAR